MPDPELGILWTVGIPSLAELWDNHLLNHLIYLFSKKMVLHSTF